MKFVIGFIALAGLMGMSLTSGELNVSYAAVFRVMMDHLGLPLLPDVPVSTLQDSVIWHYRLPRIMAAALGGSSLALCGVILQAVLRNPLAEPYVLGLSAGASAGAVAVTVIGFSWGWALSAGAFAGALSAFIVVVSLSYHSNSAPYQTLLAGVAAAQLFNAIAACLMMSSASAEQVKGLLFWLLGDLSAVRLADIPWLAFAAIGGFILCQWLARPLDILMLGERGAFALGIPVIPLRYVLLTLCALLTALVVSRMGAVGFVGMVVPHMARYWMGSQHSRRIPAAMLIGALFMVGADFVARTLISAHSLPIGVVTAIIGAPMFAWLLKSKVFLNAECR